MLCEKGVSATPYANKKWVAFGGTKTPLFKHTEHTFSHFNSVHIVYILCNDVDTQYTGWRKKRGHPISLQIF